MINSPLYPFQPKRFPHHGHALSYLDEGSGESVVVLAEKMNAWAIGQVGSPLFIGPIVCVILLIVGVASELRNDEVADADGTAI